MNGRAGMGVRGKGRRLSSLPCFLDVETKAFGPSRGRGCNHSNRHPRAGGNENVARKGKFDEL
jgi:hypothetical protein